MLRLVIEDGEGTTHVVPLIRDEITIGRQDGNTIRLTERNVSRCHARLTKAGTEEHPTIFVEDLDSYNGVRVNGDRIFGKCALQPADTIQIGDYFLALEQARRTAVKSTQVAERAAVSETDDDLEPTQETLDEEHRARLIVVSSNLAGEVYWLQRRETLIGRTTTDENDVVINHRSISRNHVKVVWRDGSFTVIDLASANGILVNGNSTTTSTLVNGDIIEMGHVKLRYSAAGDTYEFTMADIDDVTLPPRMSAARVMMLSSLVALVGLAAYVVTNATSRQVTDVERPKSAVTQGASVEQSGSDAQGIRIVPSATSSRADEVLSLIDEGERYIEAKKWDEASAIFTRILQSKPASTLAVNKLKTVQREKTNRRLLQEIEGHVAAQNWVAAREVSESFDNRSVYFGEVSRLDQSCLEAMKRDVDKTFAEGLEAVENKRTKGITMAVDALNGMHKAGYPLAKERAETLKLRRVAMKKSRTRTARTSKLVATTTSNDKRRASSNEEVVKINRISSPKPEQPAAKVSNLSYTALLKRANELMYGPKHKQAETLPEIERLVRTAIKRKPNSPEAYLRMCLLQRRLKRFDRALTYCEDAASRSSGRTLKYAEGLIESIRRELNQ